MSQQSSSADTKPVARRIENSEPIIFDLREGHGEAEDHGIRVDHFYIGDDEEEDDDEPEKEGSDVIETSEDTATEDSRNPVP